MVCDIKRYGDAGARLKQRSSGRLQPWKRFAADIVWNVAGAAFNQGSTLALGLVVANALGRDQYGVFGFLQSTMLLFMNIGQMAMGLVATKFVGEYRIREKERAGRVMVLCLGFAVAGGSVAALTAFVLAPSIASAVFHTARPAILIRLATPAIFFMIVAGTCSGILAGFGNFRKNALAGVAGGVAYIGIGAAMALRFGLAAVITGISISAAVQALLLVALALGEAKRNGVPVRWRGSASFGAERGNLLHVAVPAALTGFSTLPALWLANAILARESGGIAALALFTAANALRQVVLFAPYLISSVGFSVLSAHRGTANEEGFRHAFWMNMLAVLGTAAVLAAAIVVAGPQLLRIFGHAFADAYPVLVVLAVSTIPEALSIALYQLIQSRGLLWLSLFFVALPRDSALVVCAFFFSRRQGALGLAEAFMISILIMLASNLVLARKLGIRPAAAPASAAA
jgi:O-antigen/teichoic acid export membrane protein